MQRRTILGGLLIALLGGGAAKCDDPTMPTRDNPFPNDPRNTLGSAGPEQAPPPWEAQEDFSSTLKVVTISAWVPRAYGPYYVRMDAIDHDTGEQQHNGDPHDGPKGQRVEGGTQFRYTMAYPSNHRVELTLHLTAAKPGSVTGYVAARDGNRYRALSQLNGAAATVLNVWTKR